MTETSDPYCGPAPDIADLANAWNLDPVLIAAIALVALWLFTTGARNTPIIPRVAIILLLILAFVSPLCALTTALFSARVFHHFILIAFVAPLIALSLKARSGFRPEWLSRFPEAAFLAHTIAYWAWHLPPGYSFALSGTLNYWMMQLTLIATAVWLWWTMLVVARPIMRISLALATMAQMGFLAAILTFAPYPLFSEHLLTTQAYGLKPLGDQQLSGLIMWTLGLVPYLVVALTAVSETLRRNATREGE